MICDVLLILCLLKLLSISQSTILLLPSSLEALCISDLGRKTLGTLHSPLIGSKPFKDLAEEGTGSVNELR